ncbi:MAG: 2-phospho-L-lactate guanylyltransferase [Jiangellaceae bacterium]
MTGQTVVVPVKPWGLAKSRLRVPPAVRELLARGFALDVLDVLVNAPGVDHLVVVTTQIEMRSVAQRHGATVLADRPMMSIDSLNAAVLQARSWLMARRPSSPVVVVPTDLPALTVPVLASALELLSEHDRAFVPDAAGIGTTLLAAAAAADLRPAYGMHSARRHTLEGSRPVPEVDVRVRHDVDTMQDLARAALLGLGSHTSEVVAEEIPLHNLTYQHDDRALIG